MPSAFRSRSDIVQLDLGTLLRCVVPGWPQIRRGDRLRGIAFFCIYLFLLATGTVAAATRPGSILLGLAGAMHAASACDAVVTTFAAPRDQIAFTLVVGLALSIALYLPTIWLISRVATPIRILQSIPPFERGNVVWYSRLASVSPGDLVVFTLPDTRVGNYAFHGQWIGRVLATSGARVSTNEQRWLVDGQSSKWQPAQGTELSAGFSCVVPRGHVFVYGDGLLPEDAHITSDILRQIYVVPNSRITGRLYFRSLPVSQMTTF